VIAIDTNVLVRVLIDEPSETAQITAARALVADARNVFVSQVVLVETVWVLESAYQLPKAEVLEALDHLVANAAFSLDEEARCSAAVRLFHESNADFADCLILTTSRARGLELHTFDKRLSKLAGAKRVLTKSNP
jgi:predicted nucleic-acid-binding protein